jgi:hypothetical protein
MSKGDDPGGGEGVWTFSRLCAAVVVTIVAFWVVMASLSRGTSQIGASEVVVICFGLIPWMLPYVSKITYSPTGGEVDTRALLSSMAQTQRSMAQTMVHVARFAGTMPVADAGAGKKDE